MIPRWTKGLSITAVALLGVIGFLTLMSTRTRPGRRPRPTAVPLVTVVEARPASVPVVIQTMGGVQAARLVRVQAQVGGKVIRVSPQLIPGGQVRRKEVLAWIDPSDYDLAVRASRAAVAEAQLALDVQLGQRAVAKRELQLLRGKLKFAPDRLPLASRESYVENARVQLDAAKSRLEQALLARRRTVLRAPFDARVSEKSVDVGQVVSTQSVLATLVASDEVWVETTLPVEQLQWIDLPDASGAGGSPALVRQKLGRGVEAARPGVVLGLLPGLQNSGKLARLLVRVSTPFEAPGGAAGRSAPAKALPLLVGAFVHVEIQGRTLRGLFPMPRAALRENKRVWVREPSGTLAFRSVTVVWSRGDTVYLRGLKAGEKVISSRLSAPLPGMKVSLVKEEQRPPSGRRREAGAGQPAAREARD